MIFKRVYACLIVFGVMLVLGTLSSLGFGVLSNIQLLEKSILDMFDILSNYILLPIVAIVTCVIAGWFIDRTKIHNEIGLNKNRFIKGYFDVVVRFIAPIVISIILVTGLLEQFGVIVM